MSEQIRKFILHFAGYNTVFCGQRELLGADRTWVCGVGRLWGATPVFGWVQRQPLLSPAPQQQVETGD
jgi:hypothetical protein